MYVEDDAALTAFLDSAHAWTGSSSSIYAWRKPLGPSAVGESEPMPTLPSFLMNVYPNPAVAEAAAELKLELGGAGLLELISPTGVQVWSQPFDARPGRSEVRVDPPPLPAGAYILRGSVRSGSTRISIPPRVVMFLR
jgi:hypothetical protein